MTGRKQILVLLILLVAAIATRLVLASVIKSPGIVDAIYYYDTGARLAEGKGLTTQVVWNYLTPPDQLEHPAHAYWGPLLSLLLALFFLVAGVSWKVSLALMTLLSVGFFAMTVLIGVRLFRSIEIGLLAVVFLVLNVPLTFLSVTTDTPVLFALLVNASLLCLVGARDGKEWLWAPAGLLAGLSNLARQDGTLVVLIVIGFAVQYARQTRQGKALYVFPLLVGLVCLLPLAPWYVHNASVFGKAFPAPTWRLLTMRSYNELFFWHQPANASGILDRGIFTLLYVKAKACLHNVATLFDKEMLIIFIFGLFSIPTVVQDKRMTPFWAYGTLLVCVLGAVFPFHSKQGTFFRSGIALYPFVACASIFGFYKICDWARLRVRKHRTWRSLIVTAREAGMHALVLMFVGIWIASVVWEKSPLQSFPKLNEAYSQLDRWVEKNVPPASAAPNLMSNISLDVAHHCQRPTAQVPRDADRNVLFTVARKYRIGHLVIFRGPSFRTSPFGEPVFRTRDGTLTLVHTINVGGAPRRNGETPPGPLGIRKILVYRFGGR